MGKGVAVAVIAIALILIVVLAIAMSSQKHYYGTLKTPGVWEIKLGTLHRTSPPKTVTIRLSDVAWLVIKGSRAEVKINMSKYREVWLRENSGFCAEKECDAFFKNCRCLRWAKYVLNETNVTNSKVELIRVRFKVVNITRDLTSNSRLITVKIPIIIPRGLVNIYDYNDNNTYVKHVLVPLMKYLSTSPKELARNIADLIAQSGYNPKVAAAMFTIEEFLIRGGVCADWTAVAYTLRRYFNLTVVTATVHVGRSGEEHAFALLCNTTWWRNGYGLRIYLRNGTMLECYAWVDTGYAFKYWDILKVDSIGGINERINKIEKLVNGRWIKVYPHD